MQRPDLGADEGMVFIYPGAQRQSYWMKDTPEPLDIAFVDPEGSIVEIYPMLPLDERSTTSHSDRIQYVVEMPHGWFEEHGVRTGARIDKKALAEAVKARGFDPTKFGFQSAGP